MTAIQSERATDAWAGLGPEERRRRVRPAVDAASERRRRAYALLGAVEAAGLRVVPVDDERAEAK